MIGLVNDKNRTILWDIPQRPPGLLNISKGDQDGSYVLGQNFFHIQEMPLTNIFRRKVAGNAEEFLLGAVSVMLIAILSEIVQAILMHTRRTRAGKASRRGVQVAFLVDEFYHFRNVTSHLFGKISRRKMSSEENYSRRKKTYTSLAVLCIALALMAADVFAVYLTQPSNVLSSRQQYNLRGVHPIETERGLTKWIRRLSRQRPCSTPTFTSSAQTRRFSVSACVLYDIDEAHNDKDAVTDEISVSSFFHRAGSDHFVTFGQANISISTRAYLYLNDSIRRFQFDMAEFDKFEDFSYHKFLHKLFLYSSIEYNCNHRKTPKDKTCDDLVEELDLKRSYREVKEIVFWTKRRGDVKGNVTGYTSTYKIAMNNAFETVDHGVNPLVVTGIIQEVKGPGTYVHPTSEVVIDNIDGLLSEEGRLAGLVLFLTILVVFAIILMILRTTLRPASLGEMAWAARDRDSDLSSKASDGDVLPTAGSHGSSAYFDFDEAGTPEREDPLSREGQQPGEDPRLPPEDESKSLS